MGITPNNLMLERVIMKRMQELLDQGEGELIDSEIAICKLKYGKNWHKAYRDQVISNVKKKH